MNKFIEKQREIPVINEVDVLVVGGGPSGVGAAIGAAKSGAKTLIIENLGSFGGMWTNGMVITLAGFNNWLTPYQRCVDGVAGEWIRRAEKRGGAANNRSWVLHSDPEIMKSVADDMMMEYGVECLLHTWAADVILEGDKLTGIIIENIDGRQAIMAKSIIDCTGNGVVFEKAGAAYITPKEMQPMTIGFFLAQVEPNTFIDYEEEILIPIGPEPGYMEASVLTAYQSARRDVDVDRFRLKQARKNGEFPEYGGPWFGGLRENFPWVNSTRVYGNGAVAADLTKAEMEGRRNAHQMADFYRKEFKGFEKSWLMSSASTIGIRETRQLDGVFQLTGKDVVDSTKFDDSIALCAWSIDIHPPAGFSGQHQLYVSLPFEIPYRVMVPKVINNLLVSGRCVSVDREAMAAVRVGATCSAMGHAAGVAAAISAQTGVSVRDLDVKDVQKELLKQNAIISTDAI